MKKIGILISGRGSNMLALIRAVIDGRIPDAEVAIVISNTAGAPGLEMARECGVDTVTLDHRGKTREEHDRAMAAELRAREVDLVCLAGYMRLLSPWFTREFEGRILNIHPSLLPAFPGLNAQRQAIEYGMIAGEYLVKAFARDNLQFSTWRNFVDRHHLGRQLRIRHACYRAFFGPRRDAIERVLPRLTSLLQVGIQDFAGKPLSKRAALHGVGQLVTALARERMRAGEP